MWYLPKHLLTIDGTSIYLMYTGDKMGNGGEWVPPGGRTMLTNMMKIVCIPHVCHGTWPIEERGGMGYLKWSDEVSCWTSSQIWGSLYFPRFLLRYGSLMQRSMVSIMVLVMLCVSLPTIEKQSTLMGCPVAWLYWQIGEGYLRCSFSLCLKVLPDSSIYSLLIVYMGAFKLVYYPILLCSGILVFQGH